MEIEIQLVSGPISARHPSPLPAGAGAWVEFSGVVRGEENGQPIAALEYEAYAPMAEREMRKILEDLAARHPCLAARVIHRTGIVPAGEAAIYAAIAGRHRAEALAMLGEFMDRLKQDVPIWKRRALPRLEKAAAPAGGLPPAAHSAAEVRELLRQWCPPLGVERVALAEATGRVLRETVAAPEDQPPFDRSSVDGFAVRLEDGAARFRIVDEIRAGDWKPRVLQPGEAVRIATGGALPGEGLRVVMKEDALVEGDALAVRRRDGGRNIRFRGEDAAAGQALVEAGAVLSPGVAGLLASVGCSQPLVTRRPRALHVATGNEIVAPEQTPGRGQIRDSNSTLVRAFLGQWGIAPEQRRVAEEGGLHQSALEGADLVLISGGASVGRHDFTRQWLEAWGFAIQVSKTTARPGKPLIVARRGGALAFGLPGNPLAHFVCLNLYVRCALECWSGQGAGRDFQEGALAAGLAAGGEGRETFWPAHWRLTAGRAELLPLRWKSSGDLTALASANALIRVPRGARDLAAGERVEFLEC